MKPYSLLTGLEKTIYRWIKNPVDFLVICTTFSKNEYAKIVLSFLVEKKNSDFHMVDENRFFDILGEDKNDRHKYLEKLNECFSHDMLVFNGMANSPMSAWRENVYEAFIDKRYSSLKPTVILTQLSPEAIHDMSCRISSRIFSCQSYLIHNSDALSVKEARMHGLYHGDPEYVMKGTLPSEVCSANAH